MDFVLGFPKIARCQDNVFMVVDHFSKMAHFIPCKKRNDVSQVIGLLLRYILIIHGFSLNIGSDRDSKFTR